jgi:HD-GYP domain-containing protein (c-di-GMP phosphodiesterase class II)
MSMSTVSLHTIITIQAILRQIEAALTPAFSRQEIETMLMRRVSRILDRALPWQCGHGRRTARLAESLGTAAGLSVEALHHLTLASVLHDIGLLALPKSLAAASGFLDSRSYAALQCHSRLGAQWLEPFRFLKRASVIIAHHHERWDGSGYPYGIRGTFIPIEARVLAIADAFDAIKVPRVHDPQVRNRVAYRIVKAAAGTQFDPELVELFRYIRPDERGPLKQDQPDLSPAWPE